MTDEQIEAYKQFMYDPQNEYCCEKCPENQDFSGNLPCGQQHCWVTVHCHPEYFSRW